MAVDIHYDAKIHYDAMMVLGDELVILCTLIVDTAFS